MRERERERERERRSRRREKKQRGERDPTELHFRLSSTVSKAFFRSIQLFRVTWTYLYGTRTDSNLMCC